MHGAVQETQRYNNTLKNGVWNAKISNLNLAPDHHKFRAVQFCYTLRKLLRLVGGHVG